MVRHVVPPKDVGGVVAHEVVKAVEADDGVVRHKIGGDEFVGRGGAGIKNKILKNADVPQVGHRYTHKKKFFCHRMKPNIQKKENLRFVDMRLYWDHLFLRVYPSVPHR